MPIRPPFIVPGNRIPDSFYYEPSDDVFLELLKNWQPDQYKEKTGSSIKNKRIRNIKEDIRNKLFTIQNHYCAFCGIDLKIVKKVHREHIAPQSQHHHYIFERKNIVLACFDCNDYKEKKQTVVNDTGDYETTTFNILHPFRDNYGDYLFCDYENGGFWIDLLDGITDLRAKNTIDKLGFKEPGLIKERGMRIKNALIPSTAEEDELIRKACGISNRKAVKIS